MTCETCCGAGEIYTHTDDCENDSCALAGGIYDCLGQRQPCPECTPNLPRGASGEKLISDARTIAARYLDADMSDVFSGGYDSDPVVCAALDGLRAALSTPEASDTKGLVDALEKADTQVSHGLMGDWSIALREIRKTIREALAQHRGSAR